MDLAGVVTGPGERGHCPTCSVSAELAEHRDTTAGGWSIRAREPELWVPDRTAVDAAAVEGCF